MRHGARAESAHFLLVGSMRKEQANGCAAVVSKKVARLSVSRHRLKRRMLFVMRPWCRGTIGLIVTAKSGAGTLPFSTLKEELEMLLSRVFGTL